MSNILPGLPIIESPLFLMNIAECGFTEEEERIAISLHTNGYAIFDFPDTDLDARIERIKRNMGPIFEIDFANATSDKTNGQRRIQDAWSYDEDVREIASNQIVCDLLTKLYGRQSFPFQTLNFPVGTQQATHSDSVHFSSLPERFMCGVWVAMEDVTPDAGPLYYYPGSHRWPVLTNGLINRRGFGSDLKSAQDPYENVWQAMIAAYGSKSEVFLPRKGQALIWCANLLHGGSYQQDVTKTRWSQVTHYYFDNCVYYTPAFSDETIGQLHLRKPVSVADGVYRESAYLGNNFDYYSSHHRNSIFSKIVSLLKY